MGFSVNLSIDYELAKVLQAFKKPLLLFFILSSFIIISNSKNINIIQICLFLIFPTYYLAISAYYKEVISFQIVIMYFLWSIYVTVIGPSIMGSYTCQKTILTYTLWASIIIVAFGILSMTSDSTYFSEERMSFGYENPNYFAQYLQIGLLSIVLLNNGFKNINILHKVIFITYIFLIGLVVSRNVMTFILAYSFWYYAYNLKIKLILKIFSVVFIAILFGFLNLNEINSFSHGRIMFWSFQLNEMSNQGDYTFLFGAKEYIDVSDTVLKYSRFSEEQTTTTEQKMHSDNIYIELLLESGLFGLLMFILPYGYIWKLLQKKDKVTKRLYESIYIGAFFQGIFITNFTSFFSPISLFLGLIFLTPILKVHGHFR